MADVACVVPTCRPDRLEEFRKNWDHLFRRHNVRLVVVRDGDEPQVEEYEPIGDRSHVRVTSAVDLVDREDRRLFCRHTDAVRNYGFVYAAKYLEFDYLLTLDDDVAPVYELHGREHLADPISSHLSVMGKKCSTSWMNAAMGTTPDDIPYLRGHPYDCRTEATIHMSHGVWEGVPDFDARTQLAYGDNIPTTLDFYRGPVPQGVYMPICGMNVMVSRESLPMLYFAPQGPDSGDPSVNRFGDIWMGIELLRAYWGRKWAVWTGTSVVLHTRASDAHKNLISEEKGIAWNEIIWKSKTPRASVDYLSDYAAKMGRYRALMGELLGV